jgi:hypothetical protein
MFFLILFQIFHSEEHGIETGSAEQTLGYGVNAIKLTFFFINN